MCNIPEQSTKIGNESLPFFTATLQIVWRIASTAGKKRPTSGLIKI